MRSLPEKLIVTEDYGIGEALTESCVRILLGASTCYLDDDDVCLEDVIEAVVARYNEHSCLLAYTGYVESCNKVGKRPQHYPDFRRGVYITTN